jgi:uncharacterized protein (TIGR02266 family)
VTPEYDDKQKDGVVFSNQRSGPRASIHIEVTVTGPHNFFRGFTEDISGGGLFIATHQFYPIGTEFNLTLIIGNDELTVLARVAWIRESSNPLMPADTEPGMGLQFVYAAPDQRCIIEEFIKKKEPIFFDADM